MWCPKCQCDRTITGDETITNSEIRGEAHCNKCGLTLKTWVRKIPTTPFVGANSQPQFKVWERIQIKGGMMKTIGKCAYCKDPIYDFQAVDKTDKYHAGCKQIKDKE